MGKAFVYGDNLNTDLIIPGKYTKTLDFTELASHCLEDLDASFIKEVKKGDVLVAGINFGCGSSREQAPIAIRYAGISAVIAKSYARIFYRNAINVGLPVLECDTDMIKKGDEIRVDLNKGTITVNNKHVILCQSFSPVMQGILKEGGLVPFLKKNGDFII